MSISNLLVTDTFRTWFNKTNAIVDELNNATLVAGQTVYGAFALGANSNTSFSALNSLFVNLTSVAMFSNTTFNANVVIGSSANMFNISAKTLLLQSISGTTINGSPFTVNANATFLGPMTANGDFAIAGNTTSNNLVVTGTANVGGALNCRQLLFTLANAMVVPAALTSPQYNDYTTPGLDECSIVNFTPNIDTLLTGISAPNNVSVGGRVLYVQNLSGSFKISIASQSSASQTNNQFKTPGDAQVDIPPGSAVPLIYTTTNRQWRLLAPPGGAVQTLSVGGSTTLNGPLTVNGLSQFNANATFGYLFANNIVINSQLNAATGIFNTLTVISLASLQGNTNFTSKLTVSGAGGRLVVPVGTNMWAT